MEKRATNRASTFYSFSFIFHSMVFVGCPMKRRLQHRQFAIRQFLQQQPIGTGSEAPKNNKAVFGRLQERFAGGAGPLVEQLINGAVLTGDFPVELATAVVFEDEIALAVHV